MKKAMISFICIICVLSSISWIPEDTIYIKEMERISLDLFHTDEDDLKVNGYQIINGKLSKLPIGSTLDSKTGILYWLPGPGFLGEYEFVFKSMKLKEEKKFKICITPRFGGPTIPEVREAISRPWSSQPPFGSFDTPTDGSTVRSSIAVTGWALDDTGIETVKIYRTQGNNLVYIGDAMLVEGARPDVAAKYPGYPHNTKAGWGYMMLTNYISNGIDGTYTIKAIATDTEGNQTTLGTKKIYVDNKNAVKPFGAIDTPTQGGRATGKNFINWGWVLTPQPNIIPTDGSTIKVWVDGVYIGNPTYNLYRKDVADFFPGYANSNGAVGYFYLDTTTYTSGVHTIQWTALDSGGNTDGIGSRYFLIKPISVNGTDTEVVSESTTESVTDISDDGMTITFDSNAEGISNLDEGDFIVGDASNTFPYGILREIIDISTTSSTNLNGSTSVSYVVKTETATFEDVIEDADISKSVQLSPADIMDARTAEGVFLTRLPAANDFSLQVDKVLYDLDGNYQTTDDQVKLEGEINFSPQLDFHMKIVDWQLKEYKTAFTFSADIEVITTADLNFDLIDKTATLFETHLSPITIMAGPIPVVITPKIEIIAGIKGEASVFFQFGAGAGVMTTVGVQYKNGQWSPISNLETNFYTIGPTLDASLNVRGQVGPKFTLFFYDVAGPYITVNAYGELNADINKDPWWQLYGGFNVVGGVIVKILSHVLADYSVEILDYKVELANSGISEPDTYTLDVTKGEGVNGTPNSGSTTYDEGTTVNYSYSLQSGYTNLVVKLDGKTVANSGKITMDRDHTLVATAVKLFDVRGRWMMEPGCYGFDGGPFDLGGCADIGWGIEWDMYLSGSFSSGSVSSEVFFGDFYLGSGTWTRNGNNITITFPNAQWCGTYSGTVTIKGVVTCNQYGTWEGCSLVGTYHTPYDNGEFCLEKWKEL